MIRQLLQSLLPVSKGGTGANNATDAKTNLAVPAGGGISPFTASPSIEAYKRIYTGAITGVETLATGALTGQQAIQSDAWVGKPQLATGALTGTPVAGATLSQAVSGATATVDLVIGSGGSTVFNLSAVSGVFDTTNLVTGTNIDLSTFTFTPPTGVTTPTAVVGAVVTQANTGATGTVATVVVSGGSNNFLYLTGVSGSFNNTDVVTGVNVDLSEFTCSTCFAYNIIPVVNATLAQATSGATATATVIHGSGVDTRFELGSLVGTFDTSHVVTGTNTDGGTFTFTPPSLMSTATTTPAASATISQASSGATAAVLGYSAGGPGNRIKVDTIVGTFDATGIALGINADNSTFTFTPVQLVLDVYKTVGATVTFAGTGYSPGQGAVSLSAAIPPADMKAAGIPEANWIAADEEWLVLTGSFMTQLVLNWL